MIFIRFLVLVFNVAVITFLIYELIRVAKEPMERWRKRLIISGGILLLISPLAMFLRFIPASPQYLLIYPVAISLFIYLIRKL
jgi:hypothetical protein